MYWHCAKKDNINYEYLLHVLVRKSKKAESFISFFTFTSHVLSMFYEQLNIKVISKLCNIHILQWWLIINESFDNESANNPFFWNWYRHFDFWLYWSDYIFQSGWFLEITTERLLTIWIKNKILLLFELHKSKFILFMQTLCSINIIFYSCLNYGYKELWKIYEKHRWVVDFIVRDIVLNDNFIIVFVLLN